MLAIGMVIGINGCATTQEKATETQKTPSTQVDPYEHINRKIYSFNDTVDEFVAKPVSDAYKFITPDFVETGVTNFFNNLKNINVVTNDLLQGKFKQSGLDTGRLLMNTTLGMAGLFDVAKTVGLPQNDEDFDQTLAVWGIPQGTYIVLPLLGPITTRGIPGAVFDSAANPVNYVGIPAQALSLVNTRANAEGSLKFIDEAALDPYVFTRESFLQWRNHLATDGKDDSNTDITDLDLGDDTGSDKNTATKGVPESGKPSITSDKISNNDAKSNPQDPKK